MSNDWIDRSYIDAHTVGFDELPGLIPLDGTGVQLSNNGGKLVLQDNDGNQVDSVTNGGPEGGPPDHFVRFKH